MGQIIKLTESQFKKVITETIKKVLKEAEFTNEVEEKIKILKSNIRSLAIELAQAPNSKKQLVRDQLKEIEIELKMLRTPQPQPQQSDDEEVENGNYTVSYIRHHEEGASENSFDLNAKNPNEAKDKAQQIVNSYDSGFGSYVISIYDKMSKKYIYNQNKGQGGYSKYDRW